MSANSVLEVTRSVTSSQAASGPYITTDSRAVKGARRITRSTSDDGRARAELATRLARDSVSRPSINSGETTAVSAFTSRQKVEPFSRSGGATRTRLTG